MKRNYRHFFVVFLLMLLLCGCNKKEEKAVYDPAGKTFYNTVDRYGNEDHSKVWFGKDGSFVVSDNYEGGTYEVNGKWSVSEDVITLNVEKSGYGDYDKLIFEYKDEDNIILRTSLAGSRMEDIFSTKEVKGSEVKKPENKEATTFYNASQKERDGNASEITFAQDGTFVLSEVAGLGAIKVEGVYGQQGDALMFSNFEPFDDFDGHKIYNFELIIADDDVLVLQEDLQGSRKGDFFTRDGKVPAGMQAETKKNLLFIHQPIEDVNDIFLPQVEFNSDGTFVLTENVYAGMGEYRGTYTSDQYGYQCTVTDASRMQGFMGENVKTITFEYFDAKTLVLQQDLCMSRMGDCFSLSE